MIKLNDVVDTMLEVPVAPSFTRVGYLVRRRLDAWPPLQRYDLSGRVVLITGATTGLGFAAAERLATDGATVVVVGRDRQRTEAACVELAGRSGNADISCLIADMGELDQVRAAAAQFLERHDRLDVLIHNAGALHNERRTTSDGHEATVASQVVGPFLLTSLLLPLLSAGQAPGRVLTMSSGGMYSTALRIDGLEMPVEGYKGTEQYARAKRAQVTLNELWAQRVAPSKVVFHAMHPGWADTPGVASSLPTFRKIVGPLLRSAEQGADTMIWLAADDAEPLASSGGFWLDRRRRPIHKLPSTRKTDTPERRQQLWAWVSERSGVEVATAA